MKARIFWIDIVKFIAILFVILAHVVWIVEQDIQVTNILSNDFLTFNRIIATLGVPLFMLVSGSLLLGFCSQARSSSMVCQVDSNLLSVDSIPESFKKQADFCIYIFINSYCSLYLYL